MLYIPICLIGVNFIRTVSIGIVYLIQCSVQSSTPACIIYLMKTKYVGLNIMFIDTLLKDTVVFINSSVNGRVLVLYTGQWAC